MWKYCAQDVFTADTDRLKTGKQRRKSQKSAQQRRLIGYVILVPIEGAERYQLVYDVHEMCQDFMRVGNLEMRVFVSVELV